MKPTSLRGRLRWMIIALLLLFLLPLAFYSFRRTSTEMAELSDARLAEAAHTIAALIQRAGLQTFAGRADIIVPVQKKTVLAAQGEVATHESEVGFQVFDRNGKLLLGTVNLMTLPATPDDRSAYHDLKKQHHWWRVFNFVDPHSGYVIRTADRYDSREDIVHTLWLDHGLPFLFGLPVLALLVGWAVGRGLRPLASLTTALSEREPGNRERIMLVDAPRELRPVLGALNEQLTRQEDALERERRFSADVAHELRTPLASIRGYAELTRRSPHELPADVTRSLGRIESEATRMTSLVEDLLLLARLDEGRELDRDPVDLSMLLIDALSDAHAAGPDHTWSIVLPEEPVEVIGDQPRLHQVVTNLLANARVHTPEGTKVVAELAVDEAADRAIISITDDGPGIPDELRSTLFERFARGDSSRNRATGSTGLGLAIVSAVVDAHGGELAVRSEPGETVFSVSLPLAHPDGEETP